MGTRSGVLLLLEFSDMVPPRDNRDEADHLWHSHVFTASTTLGKDNLQQSILE